MPLKVLRMLCHNLTNREVVCSEEELGGILHLQVDVVSVTIGFPFA